MNITNLIDTISAAFDKKQNCPHCNADLAMFHVEIIAISTEYIIYFKCPDCGTTTGVQL